MNAPSSGEKRRIILPLIAALAVLVIFLSGCPGTKCSSGADCSSGQACVQNYCVATTGTACSFDGDCGQGSICVDSSCVASPSCSSDDDCDDTHFCKEGVCSLVLCTSDNGCGAGEECSNYECVASSGALDECEDFDFEAELANIESQFNDGICDALPDRTTRISEMANLYIEDPKSFDINITTEYPCRVIDSLRVTAEIAYPDYLSFLRQSFEGKDYLDCTILSFMPPEGYTYDMKYCVVPLKVSVYAGDELVTEETGSVDMWFNGEFTYDPGADLPVDALNRMSCEVNIDKVCPEIEGSSLCGQCSYSAVSNRYAFIKGHRGECRYCDGGKTCDGGDPCGDIYCSGGSSTTDTKKYYASCSQCPSNMLYNYNGYSYEWCNDLYNKCVARGCGKILDNCR